MKTIDIHTHLLSPEVRFDRLVDRLAVRFFGRSLGIDPEQLAVRPYEAYVEAFARAVRESKYVDRVCVFGVDARFDERGRQVHRDRTVCAMSDDVVALATRYPDQFIPFFSINPRRPGALDLIDEQVEKGCRGAKFLQNYWGVDLNDEALLPYYEKLKQHRLPLIVHIGSEYSIQSFAAYERIEMLRLPVASGVTVVAAHMGLGRINDKLRLWRNFSKASRYFDDDYFRLLDMLLEYENLYADISAMLVPMRARALRHLSEQEDVHGKILFGSDYPVPFPIRFNAYDLSSETRKRIDLIENPFDRYASAVLEYFPPGSAIYTNYRKVLTREAPTIPEY
jgi:predicted TIM-barrel fold metal-dependent hydrolase